jgi:hypothetical protein
MQTEDGLIEESWRVARHDNLKTGPKVLYSLGEEPLRTGVQGGFRLVQH